MRHKAPKYLALLVFFTNHHTMQAEELLQDHEINYNLVIKPRHITTDCGLAIEVPPAEVAQAQTELSSYPELEIEGVYTWQDGWEKA